MAYSDLSFPDIRTNWSRTEISHQTLLAFIVLCIDYCICAASFQLCSFQWTVAQKTDTLYYSLALNHCVNTGWNFYSSIPANTYTKQ